MSAAVEADAIRWVDLEGRALAERFRKFVSRLFTFDVGDLLKEGRGNREDVVVRYLCQWILRKALGINEIPVATLFGQNRCTIAVGVDAVEDWLLDDASEPALSRLSDLFEREESLRKDKAEFQSRFVEVYAKQEPLPGRSWKTARIARSLTAMGGAPANAPQSEADAILFAEAEQAKARDAAAKGRKQADELAKQRQADMLRQRADQIDTIRNPESRFQTHEITRLLGKVCADPRILQTIDPKKRITITIVAEGQTSHAPIWVYPKVSIDGNRTECCFHADSKTTLEALTRTGRKDEPSILYETFLSHFYRPLNYPIQYSSASKTYYTLVKLTKVAPSKQPVLPPVAGPKIKPKSTAKLTLVRSAAA